MSARNLMHRVVNIDSSFLLCFWCYFTFFFFFFAALGCMWCLHSLTREPAPPALEMLSLNHWTIREVPTVLYYNHQGCCCLNNPCFGVGLNGLIVHMSKGQESLPVWLG